MKLCVITGFLLLNSITLCLGVMTEAEMKEVLDAHNRLRREIANGQSKTKQPQAGDMMEMTWNYLAAEKAQNWANQCQFGHDPKEERYFAGSGYVGQNMASGGGSLTRMVMRWYNEDVDYTYQPANGGAPTCKPGQKCGHYTQLVWHNSHELGCGVTKCGYGRILICNYHPGGNIQLGMNKPVGKPYRQSSRPCGVNVPGRTCVNGLWSLGKGNGIIPGKAIPKGWAKKAAPAPVEEKKEICQLVKGKNVRKLVDDDNLAKGKPSTQSSTEAGGVASRGNDGNTDGNFNKRSCTHTSNRRNNYWEVDLGKMQNIEKIKVWNRKDCCTSRLARIEIQIAGSNKQYRTCAKIDSPRAREGPEIKECKGKARYVKLVQKWGILSLCEVEVLGKSQKKWVKNPDRNVCVEQGTWSINEMVKLLDGKCLGLKKNML